MSEPPIEYMKSKSSASFWTRAKPAPGESEAAAQSIIWTPRTACPPHEKVTGQMPAWATILPFFSMT
jgi:hypothetical protein